MKKIIGFLIIIVILIVGVVLIYRHQNKKNGSGGSGSNNGNNQQSQTQPDEKAIIVQNNGGQANDTVYVWDFSQNKQSAKINTNFKAGSVSDYTLGPNDQVYFYSPADHMVESIDQSGKISKLTFTQNNGDPSNSFLFSPDNKKIIWTSNTLGPKNSVSQIFMADANGSNSQPVAVRNYTKPTYVKLYRWTNKVYFSEEPTGLGGYILFTGGHNLWSFDLDAGAYSKIIDPGTGGYITDISRNNVEIAYISGVPGRQKLNVKSYITAKTQQFNVNEGVFRVAGDAVFSPDGTVVVFDQGRSNPTSEHVRTSKIDLNTGQKNVIYDNQQAMLRTVKFIDANTILMTDLAGANYFLMNADGSNVRKVNLQ